MISVNAASGMRHYKDENGNVFLGGNYMEIGVSIHGSFGTSAAPQPSEDWNYSKYGRSSGGAYLGLFADGDGWDVGNDPVAGDFFTPGAPEERYILSYELDGEKVDIPVVERNGTYNSSQWFVLYYLDGIDRIIKEKYKIRYYTRYMDDMILLHKSKDYLQKCLKEIKDIAENELHISFNEKTQVYTTEMLFIYRHL